MAEKKQYITQVQENGRVMISEDVVATIALQAMNEVEGFAGLSTKPGADIADFIGKNWGKGIKITISDENALTIDCNISIYYGNSVINVAQDIQSCVAGALESVAGVKVVAVNVNVCGIIRK